MAFMNKKVRLGDVMMDEGVITLEQLNEALTETRTKLEDGNTRLIAAQDELQQTKAELTETAEYATLSLSTSASAVKSTITSLPPL